MILVGLTSTATRTAPGTSSRRSLQPLCRQLGIEEIDAGEVAARPRKAGDKTKPDRVFGDAKDDGDLLGCPLGRQHRLHALGRGDYRNPSAHQFGRQFRQPIQLILRPAIHDRYVLPLGIATLLETPTKSAQALRVRVRR